MEDTKVKYMELGTSILMMKLLKVSCSRHKHVLVSKLNLKRLII